MTTVTFKSWLTDERAEEVCKIMETIVTRWKVYSSENPTKEQQSKFHNVLYDFYCLPRLELHDQWEEFRNPYYTKLRDVIDDEMLITVTQWKSEKIDEAEYNDAVILRMDTMEYTNWTIDFSLVCAKEFGMWVDKWVERFGRTGEIYISKNKYPKTFDWCKKNLRGKSFNLRNWWK